MPKPLENNRPKTAPTLAFIVVLAASAGSCGKNARESAKSLTAGAAHASSSGNAKAVSKAAGQWRWSHLSDKNGVRRVELERWTLSLAKDDQVRGHYDREVTFMSLDGVPFRCSQSLRYRLTTRYTLRGTSAGGKLNLKEVEYRNASSPCDTGHRGLSSYEGSVTGDTLRLTWQRGSQTLTRASVNTELPSTPSPGVATAKGTWHWQNRREVKNAREVRVESEQWTLNEQTGGTVTGSYLRSVTVFSQTGRAFTCNGETYYQYKDSYRVRGSRTGDRLILSEIGSTPADSPCVSHKKRHLDAATGKLKGDFIVLEWRGRHKQILHR